MPIALPLGYLELAPIEMRKGFGGLAASERPILEQDRFCGRRCRRIYRASGW
jgi:hypothetical protein